LLALLLLLLLPPPLPPLVLSLVPPLVLSLVPPLVLSLVPPLVLSVPLSLGNPKLVPFNISPSPAVGVPAGSMIVFQMLLLLICV